MKILITGATGYIGRRLTNELIKDGADIRILVRNKAKLERTMQEACEVTEGSTFDPEALAKALEGIHTAYYLIHSMGKSGDFEDMDRQSAELFRDACIDAGVKKIIYLGGLGHSDSASKHLRSRMETGDILSAKPDKVQTVMFRAGVIIGSGSVSFEIIRNICQKLPAMITPKWVDTKTEPIGIDDVISYLKKAGMRTFQPDEGKVVIDIGAEVMSFKEMLEGASKVMHLKRKVIKVPVLSPKMSSYWLIIFTPVNFGVARALVEGLSSETVKLNGNAEKYFPDIKPAGYEKAFSKAIEDIHNRQVVSSWCDSSGGKACDVPFVHDISHAVYKDRYVDEIGGHDPKKVFRNVLALGGHNGWGAYNFLWQMRGILDKLAGGYGTGRGRRDDFDLRIGDSLDWWKVVDIVPDKRLLLSAQMKLPADAWLEFQVVDGYLIQTLFLYPKGILGRLYWYTMLPFHKLIFKRMAKELIEG
ncbi:MAG: SDR family oxidoreductase [Deferribacterales bacterium]